MKKLIAIKTEMTQVYAEDGNVTPVTVLDVAGNTYVAKFLDENNNPHVEIGKGNLKNPNKSQAGKYAKSGIIPRFTEDEKVTKEEFDSVEVGQNIDLNQFLEVKKVKVTGVSKGKGFQGVVKRWGFAGGPKTHGQSDKWRSPGSIGSGTTPGRVYKGKKMAGRMGGDTKSVLNLKLHSIDVENNLILVKGSVPGSKGAKLVITFN